MIEQEQAKTAVDVVAGGTTFAAMMSWVPEATTILAFVWLALRIWGDDAVKGWTGRAEKTEDKQ